MNKKILSLRSLVKKIRALQKRGKRIVFTNGCFDIIHAGHVRCLSIAKRRGDVLVVGLNSDASVAKLKGKNRPIFNQKDRAQVLAGLDSVNFITIFNEDNPGRLIKHVRPDILVKGGDWGAASIVGSDFVKSYGGKVLSLPYFKGYSTSSVIDSIAKSRSKNI